MQLMASCSKTLLIELYLISHVIMSGFPAGTVIYPHTPQKHLTHFQISKPRSIYDRLLEGKWLGLHQRIRLIFQANPQILYPPTPQKTWTTEGSSPNTTNLPKWKVIITVHGSVCSSAMLRCKTWKVSRRAIRLWCKASPASANKKAAAFFLCSLIVLFFFDDASFKTNQRLIRQSNYWHIINFSFDCSNWCVSSLSWPLTLTHHQPYKSYRFTPQLRVQFPGALAFFEDFGNAVLSHKTTWNQNSGERNPEKSGWVFLFFL